MQPRRTVHRDVLLRIGQLTVDLRIGRDDDRARMVDDDGRVVDIRSRRF
jgi:hypothetical protein